MSNRRGWWKSFAVEAAGELLVPPVLTIALFFLFVLIVHM